MNLTIATNQLPGTGTINPMHHEGVPGLSVGGLDLFSPTYLPVDELPTTWPSHRRLRFGRFYRSGQGRGVDYHHVVNLDRNRFAIVMADLSGPGAFGAAAMIAAVVGGLAGRDADPGMLLRRIGQRLHYAWNDALAATGICAIVDTRRRTLRLACAGHPAPLVVRAGTSVMPLLVHSTMSLHNVGLIVTSEYDLRSGDRLLFYTDGVTSQENAATIQYDVTRLAAAVDKTRNFAEPVAVAWLANDLQTFAGEQDPADDQTMLMVGIG